MDIAKQISKEYADKNTCYANDSDLQHRAIRKAVEYGYEQAKKQLMTNAVDVEVKVDAGGYPYIPQMELYDYNKDVPLAKEGDKYKVILIKEE